MKNILATVVIPLIVALLVSGCGRTATSASEAQQSNDSVTTTSISVTSTTTTLATTTTTLAATSTTSNRTMQDTYANRQVLVQTVRSFMSVNDSNSVSDLDLITVAKGACLKMDEPGGMASLIDDLKGHQSAGRRGAFMTQFAIFGTAAELFCPWNKDGWSPLANQF